MKNAWIIKNRQRKCVWDFDTALGEHKKSESPYVSVIELQNVILRQIVDLHKIITQKEYNAIKRK
jgi:hypothetical protein